jgi:hypothetical protein
LSQANRGKAVESLKKALAGLEDNTTLPQKRRDSLVRMLKDRIRVLESEADQAAAKPPEAKKGEAKDRAAKDDRQIAESQKINRGFATIQELREKGKTEDAAREASKLASQFPRNTAVKATERTTNTVDQIANARKLQKERERGWVLAHRDMERSAISPSGDIEFPKDWKEKTKGRTTTIQLTVKEKSILQALNTTISVDFKNSKLEDVIEYLQTYTGQPILVDKEALKDVEASYDTPVTLKVKGVTVRTVLRRILNDLGMTYVVKEEAIQVTSAQRAKDLMVVRRYYIGDLLAGMGTMNGIPGLQSGFGSFGVSPIQPNNMFGNLPFAVAFNQQMLAMQVAQNMQSVEQLKEMIQSSVDQGSWFGHGGNGTITFHAASMSFLIKQSTEVHAMLGSGGLLK